MAYKITLEQLNELSYLIGEMDGKNATSNKPLADKAHLVLQQVLGDDKPELYAPDDDARSPYMYLVLIRRAPQNAPNGRAQYRVEKCDKKWFKGFINIANIPAIKIPKGLIIETNKPYREGNLINFEKALGKALIVPKQAS
jgi:hypothetical protein